MLIIYFDIINKILLLSLYQIFQEMIHDLLNPTGQDLRVRQHPQLGMWGIFDMFNIYKHKSQRIQS